MAKTPETLGAVAPAPEPDPALMRQQQLQQQLQQENKQIMDLKQQKAMVEDMIMAANDRAQRIIGALNEIAYQQTRK